MPRSSWLIAAVAALALALAPGLADARAGSGGSFGSRGGMTWSAPPATRIAPYGGAPMQRSLTPDYRSPGYNSYSYGYRSGSPFMSGLLGGLIGVGLGGLLFGHGFWHGGMGFFGLFGFLLQILLIVWLVRLVLRLVRGGYPAYAGGPNVFARGPGPMPMGGGGAQPIPINPPDYQAFEQMLQAIQATWSDHDLNALRAMTSPEMLGYFAEQLADQESRGVRNEVRDVHLLQGDLAQAWRENGRDYATVAMRFSMIDVTRDRMGRVVDGSPNEHVTATELWTFLRAPGGHWILSAIQQTR
ncbi:MAG TPA: TIM44-like domain-containing protein [Acetobacteraceae bacterium]|jgi:predicted lipid-binding transport protein (Tim44 family)|nr:TIM44-like domain-containing protein [Acetobacteraceae bacterium]